MDETNEQSVPAPQDIANVGQVPPEQPARQEIPQKLIKEVKNIASGPSTTDRLKEFIQECKRVLRVTKKPDKEEFMTIVKISAAGMAIIGVLGFLIHLVKELLI